MRKKLSLFITFIVFLHVTIFVCTSDGKTDFFQTEILESSTLRNEELSAVIIPDSDPFFGLIGTSASCWYENATNSSGLVPLLVHHNGNLSDSQIKFLNTFASPINHTLLVLGDQIITNYTNYEILGSPVKVALTLATYLFTKAPTVLILPYDREDAYHLSLIATPLASYLNIPILFYNDNQADIQLVCRQLKTIQAYLVGDISLNLTNVSIIRLIDEEAISNTILSTIKERFGMINYLTITNPSDVIPPTVINTTEIKFKDHITNRKIIVLSKEIDLIGNDTRYYKISIPDGINRIQISGEIIQKSRPILGNLSPVDPLIFMTLTDSKDHIVGYVNSMGYDIGKTKLETLTCNASGEYTLKIMVYNGIKGGFFIQRGISYVDADISITATITTLERPHLPMIPKLSIMAPYLTAAHGGLLIANTTWELTDEMYVSAARGSGTGPWYNESLHIFTNEKVNKIVNQLNHKLKFLENQQLLNGYLNGPAWLAIVADTTMIPMYYYGPSQGGIPDRGLPSDNPYSLNESLSVGRLISWNVADVSALIARTLFYEKICGQPSNQSEWHNKFSFIFGEGFGETGGIFHQIPYAKEIRNYGFAPTVYGNLRNSRQIAVLLNVYTGANYIEYLGHGDWFWLPASLYGYDIYSKAIDVAHAKDWVYEKPSIFLTSGCLMGRTDGLLPEMNIGLTMLHAGCNGFVGATRETGQESGLTTLENHLIVDDWSIGEALRGEKRIDKETPTYYVRTLYGDPAFNPYEPLNGFHNQGCPILKS